MFRHQLLDHSKINNWWSLAVTVLQRKASMQQNVFLLVPAIKGCIYVSTHFLTSQPTLIKLDNENIGGLVTPLQLAARTDRTIWLEYGVIEHMCRKSVHIELKLWIKQETTCRAYRIYVIGRRKTTLMKYNNCCEYFSYLFSQDIPVHGLSDYSDSW